MQSKTTAPPESGANATVDPEIAGGASREQRLLRVPIEQVWAREGFNPRRARHAEAYRRTERSIAAVGVLQPLLVTEEPDPSSRSARYRVVAGEGRYLAARAAAERAGEVVEVPVVVCDVDPSTGGLEHAIAENLVRDEMDPVSLADGFGRLRESGWTARQIARHYGLSQRLVTERLRIRNVPEGLHDAIANGEVPLSAIRALADLATIHPELPALLARSVQRDAEHLREAPAGLWADAVRDPVWEILRSCPTEEWPLPDGVYSSRQWFEPARLDLDAKATKNLAALAKILDRPAEEVSCRMDHQAIEHAVKIKAGYPAANGAAVLLVGRDVISGLVGDVVGRRVKDERAHERRRRQLAKNSAPAVTASDGSTGAQPTWEEREAAAKAERRREREQAAQDRAAAEAHNEELGAEAVRHLARITVDPTVLRLLVCSAPLQELSRLAGTGARLAFPGWATVTPASKPGGPAKRTYLEPDECTEKANAYLAGASSATEMAGRILTLLALSRYADQRAVAQSSRIYYASPTTSWVDGEDLGDLIDQLCADRLPAHLTAAVRDQRAEDRAQEAQEAQEQAQANERLTAALARAADLNEEEYQQAVADVRTVHGYRIEAHALHAQLREARENAPGRGDTNTASDE